MGRLVMKPRGTQFEFRCRQEALTSSLNLSCGLGMSCSCDSMLLYDLAVRRAAPAT